MTRWQVLKDGIPVQLCSSSEEAEEVYAELEADEIRCIEEDEADTVLQAIGYM